MKYAIITYGSRGDVQPYIALSLGLMDRGHTVTLLAPENFKDFVIGYGVPFYPLSGNVEELLYSPEGLRVLKTGSTVSLLRYLQKGGRELQPLVNRDMISGSTNADILIASVLTAVWVRTIAEKLNKKWGIVQLSLPTTPTKEFPFAGLAFFNFPFYNIFSYWLINTIYWQLNKKGMNEFRKSLGLPKGVRDSSSYNVLNLYLFSPQLVNKLKDWNSNSDIVGYLTLPASKNGAYQIDEGLTEWLQNGEAPIYIGFGSIPIPDPNLFCKIVNEIISQTQYRIIFCKGWSNISDLVPHPNLFVVKSVNHQWLFPQCKAAVIHGGAGTTAAALKAKISLIVVSVFADQPWWGKIIEDKELGVHIPFKKLTLQKLMKAIGVVQQSQVLKNIAEIGERIDCEDPLNKALDTIENYFIS